MNLLSNTDLKKWSAALLAAPLLAACSSMAPGMHFESVANSTNAEQGNQSQADASVPTKIVQITPQLVRQEREAREKQNVQDFSKLVGKSAPYGIEPGDVLSIVVWDHPELSSNPAPPGAAAAIPAAMATEPGGGLAPAGFVVDHEGNLDFPYAGTIKIQGMTEEQARKLLTTKLAHYIRNPKVTLRVQSYRSKRIYVDGEVKQPGLQAINDIPMTLIEAVNRAGGFLPTADQSQISLNRAGTNYQINLPDMVAKGVNPSTIMLRNGDVVRVKSRDESKVFVSGEVTQPRALPMYNGRLSLNDALGEAGGINPLSGDSGQVYVVRKSATEPVVYRLDAKTPGALAMAESFELRPKDVVYVAATPLANWHRTISMILPGALSSAVGAVTPLRTAP